MAFEVSGDIFVGKKYQLNAEVNLPQLVVLPVSTLNAPGPIYHYIDVIIGAMTSQITSLTIVNSTVGQTQIKENIKAPRHRPLFREFTGDRWIPRTNGQ